MDAWNIDLFLAVNAGAAPDVVTVAAAKVASAWFIMVAFAIVAALWIWGAPAKRGVLLTAAATLLLGLTVNFAISLIWYHPRPFEIGVGHTLVSHALETSFPSDHATFMWSLAFGLMATRTRWGWGLIIGGLGAVTAWARVYLGVHFPFDMLGSFLVAVFSAACGAAMHRPIERSLLPAVAWIYEAVLQVLHVPSALVPRRPVLRRRAAGADEPAPLNRHR